MFMFYIFMFIFWIISKGISSCRTIKIWTEHINSLIIPALLSQALSKEKHWYLALSWSWFLTTLFGWKRERKSPEHKMHGHLWKQILSWFCCVNKVLIAELWGLRLFMCGYHFYLFNPSEQYYWWCLRLKVFA